MIRQANKFDVDAIIEMLKHYRENAPLEILKQANDEEYIRNLISQIIAGAGFILVAEKDGILIGMLIAAKIPNIWNPDAMQCSEVAYWVEPAYRGGTAAYRLIAGYVAECERLIEQDAIQFYTISKMRNSPNLKYDKFGFEPLEETWVR